MERKRKINLKRHTLPPASKKYLFRIIGYIILLSVLIWIVFYLKNYSSSSSENLEVIEINNIKVSE